MRSREEPNRTFRESTDKVPAFTDLSLDSSPGSWTPGERDAALFGLGLDFLFLIRGNAGETLQWLITTVAAFKWLIALAAAFVGACCIVTMLWRRRSQ